MAPIFDVSAFSPKAFQFWSNPDARPKRAYEAIMIFPDLIFGGDGMQNIEPYLVVSFSRPGYSRIETVTGEYQLKSGDFAKVEYPTNGYQTNPLKVTLIDVINHDNGANTAAAVQTSLTLQGKTSEFEEEINGKTHWDLVNDPPKILSAFNENPRRFHIIELNSKGKKAGEWAIDRPVLSSVDFSEINYKSTNFGTINLTFQYKNFSYISDFGDRLLTNRLKVVGLERKTIANALDSAASWWSEKLTWNKK